MAERTLNRTKATSLFFDNCSNSFALPSLSLHCLHKFQLKLLFKIPVQTYPDLFLMSLIFREINLNILKFLLVLLIL